MIDAIDALAALLEPNEAKRDNTAERPYEHEPDKLYLYPRGPDVHEIAEFDHDLERFGLSADYVLATTERKRKRAAREASVALEAKAHGYAQIVRQNREGPQAGGAALWHDIRTLTTRGFRVEIRGWRHHGPS
jgi:hypothetical protein